MSRFRIKKQPLITVAGIVWLLAGLNVAILGVRAAIDMRGRTLSASPTWRGSVTTSCASSTARATSRWRS